MLMLIAMMTQSAAVQLQPRRKVRLHELRRSDDHEDRINIRKGGTCDSDRIALLDDMVAG